MRLNGRTIFPGIVNGPALVSRKNISFFGGVDPDSGIIVEKGHDLEGQSISQSILVFPSGKGSTVGSYTLYRLKANGKAPLAIINSECEPITAVGCIISEIPCIDQIDTGLLRTGDMLAVDADSGSLKIVRSDSK